MVTEHTEVHDLAGSCVLAVEQATGTRLDGTPETLPLLDHYTRLADSSGDEVVSLIAPMCGAYFGTVTQNAFPATEWHTPKGEYAQWRIAFDRCPLSFNPVGVAVEVLLGEQVQDWNAHFQTSERAVVEKALEVYGDVRESDYFTFTVRFEALDQIVRALTR